MRTKCVELFGLVGPRLPRVETLPGSGYSDYRQSQWMVPPVNHNAARDIIDTERILFAASQDNRLMDTSRKSIGEDTHIRVKVFSTGGTIEKIYDEREGILHNSPSRFDHILSWMRLPTVQIDHQGLMGKDSLDMTDADRVLIKDAVAAVMDEFDAILIVHGTDTLDQTGTLLHREIENPTVPIILTGAMRPFEFRDTDAFQNVYESLISCRLLSPGVYCVMHSKVLHFPDVHKDRKQLTFVKHE